MTARTQRVYEVTFRSIWDGEDDFVHRVITSNKKCARKAAQFRLEELKPHAHDEYFLFSTRYVPVGER